MTTLLLSSRFTEDNQGLWRAAVNLGWNVERVRGVTVPEGLADPEIVIYVESLFAPTIADSLGLTLIDPPDDWLVRLPSEYRQRDLRLTTLGDARRLTEPKFIKPPNEKSFEAKVYRSGIELPVEFDDSTAVLIAEPVTFEIEYRCFVLNRMVRTMSPYLRGGQLAKASGFSSPEGEAAEAREYASRLMADQSVGFPQAVVLDIGKIANRGWAAVELNGAWGSGIYGCVPSAALEVIRHAVVRKASS